MSIFQLEGSTLEVVPAEGIVAGDHVVAGAERCGVREVYTVVSVDSYSETDDLTWRVEDHYGEVSHFEHQGDDLIIRVKKD